MRTQKKLGWFEDCKDAESAFSKIYFSDIFLEIYPTLREKLKAYQFNQKKFKGTMSSELVEKYEHEIMICEKKISGTFEDFQSKQRKEAAAEATRILEKLRLEGKIK